MGESTDRPVVQKIPAGPERPELHFDRCQFDPELRMNGHRAEDRFIAAIDGLRIGHERRQDDSEIDWEFIKKRLRDSGVPPSEDLKAARLRGEPWATRATIENLLALPRKQALALLWRYWGGLTYEEIGWALGFSDKTGAYKLLRKAKQTLATF